MHKGLQGAFDACPRMCMAHVYGWPWQGVMQGSGHRRLCCTLITMLPVHACAYTPLETLVKAVALQAAGCRAITLRVALSA